MQQPQTAPYRRFSKPRGRLGYALYEILILLSVATVAVFVASSTPSTAQAQVCGNTIVEPPETCDPPGTACLAGSPAGTFVCAFDCLCTCDNGVVDPNEECDPSSPSGAICITGPCTDVCACPTTTTTTTPTTSTTSSSTSTTTSTTTSTVTTTSTEPNHFQCYQIKPQRTPPITGVTVEDQFGATTVTLTKTHRVCAPANKNGEDPNAPTDPDHLKSYDDKHTRPKVFNQTVTNQFGSLQLDVLKPTFLLVPAAKAVGITPPAPLTPPDPDHFQCYKVRKARGAPNSQKISGASAADQFGPATIELLKPRWLCAPANKNGEDPTAPDHPSHLLCYKTRSAVGFGQQTITTTDQFGTITDLANHRLEFCVPSTKNAPTTTTTTVTTTSTVTTTVTTTSTVTTTVTTTSTTTSTVTTTETTTSTVTTTVTTTSTTTTTIYGSPSRAFIDRVRSLLD